MFLKRIKSIKSNDLSVSAYIFKENTTYAIKSLNMQMLLFFTRKYNVEIRRIRIVKPFSGECRMVRHPNHVSVLDPLYVGKTTVFEIRKRVLKRRFFLPPNIYTLFVATETQLSSTTAAQNLRDLFARSLRRPIRLQTRSRYGGPGHETHIRACTSVLTHEVRAGRLAQKRLAIIIMHAGAFEKDHLKWLL